MQFAAIKPLYKDSGTLIGFSFIDTYGSEYELTESNGLWVSLNGSYTTWNPSTSTLRFSDGTSMIFGCTSGKYEPDANTLYPTTIQCPNGNFIEIAYQAGLKDSAPNTSSRIVSISDAESVYASAGSSTYSFSYSEGDMPRLLSIQSNTIPGNNYTFSYSPQTVIDPFSGNTSKTMNAFVLASVTKSTGVSKQFAYDAYGEMTSVVLEKGAVISWEYQTFSFADGVQVREVASRSIYPNGLQGAPDTHYFTRNSSDSARKNHSSVDISDGTGSGHQLSFISDASDPNNGLLSGSRTYSGSKTLHETRKEWSRTSQGAPYVSAHVTTLDPGTADTVRRRTEIDKDEYGNTVESRQYDSSTSDSSPRILSHSYLKHSSYLSQHILNRKLRTTVSQGSATRTLHESVFDSTDLSDVGSVSHHRSDTHGANFAIRGNATESVTNGVFRRRHYSTTGQLMHSEDSTGASTSYSYHANSNHTKISSITPNHEKSLATKLDYDQSTGALIRTTGANSATTSYSHDSFGRVVSVTSARGVTTNISYDSTPGASSITTKRSTGKWTRRVFDGSGRKVRTEFGDPSGLLSQKEFEYCSVTGNPVGKLYRSSLRHAPGDAPVWRTRTYDTKGRVLSKSLSGSKAQKTVSYKGNCQTVTDGAGRWKRIYRDANGRILQVVMPDSNGGADKVTYYTYDVSGNLTKVHMPRSNGTQTRIFKYDDNGRISLRHHAESGKNAYTYNADGTLASITDAKNQKTVYIRDSFKRAVEVNYYDANGSQIPQLTEKYYFDSNPFNSGFSQNSSGRLAAVQYGGPNTLPGLITEQYSYTTAGSLARKRVTLQRGSQTAMLESSCIYDSAGRLTTYAYPAGGPTYLYDYDSAGRLVGIRIADKAIVRNVAYAPTGKLTQYDVLAGSGDRYLTEQYQYDDKQRLIRLLAGPSDALDTSNTTPKADLAWSYNNFDKKVSREDDNIGNVSVRYRYDNNGRLATAESSDGNWGLSYSYDGFGNRTSQAITQGSAYSSEARFDPATNWMMDSRAAYDANGNALSLPYLSLTYDGRNDLVSVSSDLSGTEYYAYDLNSHRIWKKAADGTEWLFFYQNDLQIASYIVKQDGSGNLALELRSTRNYFAGRLVTSLGSAVVVDRLGAVRAWSDPNGSQTAKYFPFGEKTQASDDTKSSFGGYERDASGLDYAWHRYYASKLGRFTSPDPYDGSAQQKNPDSWNRYAFVSNDPINRVDPNGLDDYDGGDGVGWGGCGCGCGGCSGGSDENGNDDLPQTSSVTFANGDTQSVTITPDSNDPNHGEIVTVTILAENGSLDENGNPIDDSTLDSNAIALAEAINATGVQWLATPQAAPEFYSASIAFAVGSLLTFEQVVVGAIIVGLLSSQFLYATDPNYDPPDDIPPDPE